MKDSPHPHDSSVETSQLPRTTTVQDVAGEKLTDVGVAEDESLAQLVLVPVHLTTNDAKQRLAVDQDLHTVLLHNLVELARLLDVLKVVGKARATTVLDSNSDVLGLGQCHESL